MPTTFALLQLADGSFPSGGYAHSAGLEAAIVLGREALDLDAFLDASLAQAGRLALPFVRAAAATRAEIGALAELDEAFDALVPAGGPNAASRAQGRALAGAAGRVWDAARDVAEHARRGPAHHPIVFGALAGVLGVPPEAAYVHGVARGILSAAVRLGACGPIEAQRMLAARAARLATIAAGTTDVDAAAATAPLIEIHAALHERLDGRMFQS